MKKQLLRFSFLFLLAFRTVHAGISPTFVVVPATNRLGREDPVAMTNAANSFVGDGTGLTVNWASIVGRSNVLECDALLGNDATGRRGGPPFRTLYAASTNTLPGDTIVLGNGIFFGGPSPITVLSNHVSVLGQGFNTHIFGGLVMNDGCSLSFVDITNGVISVVTANDDYVAKDVSLSHVRINATDWSGGDCIIGNVVQLSGQADHLFLSSDYDNVVGLVNFELRDSTLISAFAGVTNIGARNIDLCDFLTVKDCILIVTNHPMTNGVVFNINGEGATSLKVYDTIFFHGSTNGGKSSAFTGYAMVEGNWTDNGTNFTTGEIWGNGIGLSNVTASAVSSGVSNAFLNTWANLTRASAAPDTYRGNGTYLPITNWTSMSGTGFSGSGAAGAVTNSKGGTYAISYSVSLRDFGSGDGYSATIFTNGVQAGVECRNDSGTLVSIGTDMLLAGAPQVFTLPPNTKIELRIRQSKSPAIYRINTAVLDVVKR